jgi:hypothetical protein
MHFCRTLLLLLATADAGTSFNVTFDVKEGGDVRWTHKCTVDVWKGTELVQQSVDPAGGANLEPGAYDAVVACNSDEGMVKKTVSVTVKNADVKAVPVTLEPGFLLVNVLRFDTPISAEVTIFDDKNREVAASKDKAVIPVCPGKVRVLAKVDDPKASRPVFGNASATITAKQKSTVTVDTTDGNLTVFLTDNGRKAGGVAALRAPGQTTRLMELHAGEKGEAPPGTYDLVTTLDDTHDFSEVVTKNVVIAPKGTTTKTVNHSTAVIKPTVLVDGRVPPKDAQIDVELSQPGAAAPFNTAAVGDALKVAGGATLEVSAVRKDTARDDGTPPRATQKVTVHGGEVRGVTLDITSAHLDVTALVGGKAPAGGKMEVEVDAPGNDVPVAKRDADADGKASFNLSAGKFIVKAVFHAPQGDVVTAQNVSLVLGGRLGAKLNVDVGTATVQVFEGGVAVPAEVRFFKTDGTFKIDPKEPARLPPGEMVLSVPAGQEAWVPPGAYALVVVRKGNIYVFSDLKVASGRSVERTVEVAAHVREQ